MGRPKGTVVAAAASSSSPSEAAQAPNRAEELKRLANAAIGRFDFEEALRLLDDAISLEPEQAALWSNRAYVHESLKQPAKALSDAQHCLKLAPDMPKGQLRAARALMALGRVEEALPMLERAVAQWPQEYSLRQALQEATELQRAGAGASPGPSSAAAEPPAAAAGDGGGGDDHRPLASNPYYYATGRVEAHLPLQPPQRLSAPPAAEATPAPVASGAIQRDIERKGSDSYYYAHARTTDYQVPLVPQKISADGSLTPWEPPAPAST